jgi:hypothetical protein
MDIKNISGDESGAHMGLIHEKKQRPKISCYCTVPLTYDLRGLIVRLTKSCGVSDPAEQSSAGYHTPRNNFKYEYFREL